MGRKSPARVALRLSAIFHALEGGPSATSLPTVFRLPAPRLLPRHQHLPLFQSCRDFHLSPLSILSVSPPPSSLPLSFLSASARPSDLQSRPRLPSCRSHRRVLHRSRSSRSGAFHGRSACPESLLDQREIALSNSKQITEDGNCSVLIYAFRLRPQPFMPSVLVISICPTEARASFYVRMDPSSLQLWAFYLQKVHFRFIQMASCYTL